MCAALRFGVVFCYCMKDMQLGTLLPIFLFFMLFAGILIIYREEIEKMELFGKLHTSPVPATHTNRATIPSPPDISPTIISPTTVPNAPVISFGSGRIIDTTLRDIPLTDLRGATGSLSTLSSDVSDYHARAFVEEASDLYKSSPYTGSVVFLDRVSSIKESSADREYFILLVSNVLTSPLTIAGWKVLDRQKKVAYPFPAISASSSGGDSFSITVYSGDRVVVSSGRSPVNTSFRVNKCSGYRSQFDTFVPAIRTSCVDPLRAFADYGEVPFSDDACYAATLSLPPCVTADTVPSGVTDACRDFLQNVLSEDGCISRHRNDADFYTGEWRVFLDSDTQLWKNRDNVLYLLDENDLLVASLVY